MKKHRLKIFIKAICVKNICIDYFSPKKQMCCCTQRGDIMPPGVSLISHYKPFEKQPFSCVVVSFHLDLFLIDQSTSLPPGLPAYHLDCSKCCSSIHHTSSKRLVMANHTHTWWHNITSLRNKPYALI